MNAARRDTSISGLEPHRLRLDYTGLSEKLQGRGGGGVAPPQRLTVPTGLQSHYYRGNYRGGGGGGQTNYCSTHTTAENQFDTLANRPVDSPRVEPLGAARTNTAPTGIAPWELPT